jgi:hypothetical protein
MDTLCSLPDADESKGPDTFLGTPEELRGPEEIGPEVMSPVAGSDGGRGPEFCRAAVGTPPERGPEVFLIDSPFLESGPELDFCLAELVPGTEPGTTDDTGPDIEKLERVPGFNGRGPECDAAPPNDPVLMGIFPTGPDFFDFELSTGISNILPSSPDFLMSPPV